MASFLVNLNVLSSNGMHVLYLSMDLNKKFTLKKGMCNASPSEYVDIQEYRVTTIYTVKIIYAIRGPLQTALHLFQSFTTMIY